MNSGGRRADKPEQFFVYYIKVIPGRQEKNVKNDGASMDFFCQAAGPRQQKPEPGQIRLR